jgi:broad specificity phosphatase PhoE
MNPERDPHPLILCRHGETAFNRDGLILGQEDPPLLKEGEPLIRRLGWTIARVASEWPPGAILSSPLARAAATARIHSSILGWPVETRDSLKELSAGEFSGKRRDDVVGGPFGIRQTWFERPPEGESYQDGEERLERLEEEIRKTLRRRPLMIVAHGGINRSLLKRLLGLSREEAMKVAVPHGLAYLLEGERVERLSADGTRAPGLFG